jgi:nitrous oxide reductase accessory protein NosL
MSDESNVGRRQAMKLLATAGFAGFSGIALAGSQKGVGVMIPGKGWVPASGGKCEGDGTPLQFIPKTPPDDNPLQDELTKYPRCPYCGMSRSKWHHSRHLVQYDDGLVDGTCSIHCLAISLSLNIDRGPKAIYAADFGSDATVKPLMEVDKVTYLIGSSLRGTMSMNSKMAFASADKAKLYQADKGGDLTDFDKALTLTYVGMAKDTLGIRKRRAERRRRMMEKKS